jgi:hypothetical protein
MSVLNNGAKCESQSTFSSILIVLMQKYRNTKEFMERREYEALLHKLSNKDGQKDKFFHYCCRRVKRKKIYNRHY